MNGRDFSCPATSRASSGLTQVKSSPTLASRAQPQPTKGRHAMSTTGQATVYKVPAGWALGEFIAWLQRGTDVIVTDMTDCPSGIPARVIVKRASGQVAGWSKRTVGEAREFARECNEAYPASPAHVVAWDDSVWDAVPGTQS